MKNRETIRIFIIGIALLLLLLGSCTVYKIWQSRQEPITTVVPEALGREATVNEIYNPKDIVRYMFQALAAKDLDMALRGFPIDEMAIGVDTKKIIEEKGSFSNSATIAPSGAYLEYFPLSSTEITGQVAQDYEGMIKNLESIEGFDIVSIDYARPDIQMTPEYQLQQKKLSGKWGAQNSTEMIALLSDGNRTYVSGFTTIQYWGYWKIFSFESALLESVIGSSFSEITGAEYDNLAVSDKEKKLWNIFTSSATEEEMIERKAKEKKVVKLLASEMALLTPNYFVTSQIYGDTPEDTLKKFVVYMQKQDMTAMISLGNGDENNDTQQVSAGFLERQRDFAVQIKKFYFNLLLEEVGTEEKTLEQLGESADSIVDLQSPEKMFFIGLMDVKRTDGGKGEYLVSFWYGGEEYEVNFYLKQSDRGWWIDSIGEE